jgi:hypothetical protein
MPDAAHGVRRQPTPGIVRSEIHAPLCNSPYNLKKEIWQVQPGTRFGPYDMSSRLEVSSPRHLVPLLRPARRPPIGSGLNFHLDWFSGFGSPDRLDTIRSET